MKRVIIFTAIFTLMLVVFKLTGCREIWPHNSFKHESVRKPGLGYNLLTPQSAHKEPVVLVLGGSGGGIDAADLTAQLFAKAGYTTLAVAYFGLPQLPTELVEIDVHYLEQVLKDFAPKQWTSLKITLVASSRGTELATLAATRLPQVQRLILISPSSHGWGAISSAQLPKSAWQIDGIPLPFVPRTPIDKQSAPYSPMEDMKRDLIQPVAEPAKLPLPEVNAKVLLISGGDDQVWPSAMMANKWLEAFAKAGKAADIEHLHYPAAGHVIAPNMPSDLNQFEFNGRTVLLGGTPAANQQAMEESWQQIMIWLSPDE